MIYFTMGAQQVKEGRSSGAGGGIIGHTTSTSGIGNCAVLSSSSGGGVAATGGGGGAGVTSNNAFGAGSSIRASRMKSRQQKDSKMVVSNIFTEHSGEFVRVCASAISALASIYICIDVGCRVQSVCNNGTCFVRCMHYVHLEAERKKFIYIVKSLSMNSNEGNCYCVRMSNAMASGANHA